MTDFEDDRLGFWLSVRLWCLASCSGLLVMTGDIDTRGVVVYVLVLFVYNHQLGVQGKTCHIVSTLLILSFGWLLSINF